MGQISSSATNLAWLWASDLGLYLQMSSRCVVAIHNLQESWHVTESIQLFPQGETDAYLPDPENQLAAQAAILIFGQEQI